jgi:hypothetical protein
VADTAAPSDTPPSAELESAQPPGDSPSIVLAEIANRAAGRRLTPADEEKAAQLVAACLVEGKENLSAAAELLPKLGWSASVKGVTTAWPQLKTTGKSALLKALIKDETEPGRRIRLSLARGLFKVPDLPACRKLLLSVCKEIRDKKTGEVAPKDALNFANVMIGKGKPWIAQLSLATFKPAEAETVVHCAIAAAFAVNGPPITPLGVLKWAAEHDRLSDLHRSAIDVVSKNVARWSPKWADALRKEVPGLPDAIVASLKPATTENASSSETVSESDEDDGFPAKLKSEIAGQSSGENEPETSEAGSKPKERPVYISKTIPPKETQRQANRPQSTPPPREGKGAPVKSAAFNASEALRQLESHIGWLKSELQNAERKLRTRDDERRQAKRKPDVIVVEGEPTPEELARLNVQLEARIAELQSRLDDLTVDAEARAVSSGAFGNDAAPQPDAQLRTLLGLKLQEAYADFLALETQDRDLVVQQHYRTVLAEVFDVLKAESIPLR